LQLSELEIIEWSPVPEMAPERGVFFSGLFVESKYLSNEDYSESWEKAAPDQG
jgi:hypothetical protein